MTPLSMGMSKPIAAGDLVCVIRPMPCCGSPRAVGWHFTVQRIEPARTYDCSLCGHTVSDGRPLAFGNGPEHDGFMDVSLLQRIDPAAKKESTETELELTI